MCVNVSECKSYVGTGENVLCVGDTDKTNSACRGDSGGIKITWWLKSVMISKTNYPLLSILCFHLIGPVTYTTEGKTVLYGVVNGAGDTKNYPSLYPGFLDCISPSIMTRVAEPTILEWIKTTINIWVELITLSSDSL